MVVEVRTGEEVSTEERLERALGALRMQSISTLMKVLKNPDSTRDEITKGKLAASALSSVTRHYQTQGAQQAANFMIARELAKDKDELRRYVEVTMPGSALVKALPVPK